MHWCYMVGRSVVVKPAKLDKAEGETGRMGFHRVSSHVSVDDFERLRIHRYAAGAVDGVICDYGLAENVRESVWGGGRGDFLFGGRHFGWRCVTDEGTGALTVEVKMSEIESPVDGDMVFYQHLPDAASLV